MKLKNIKASFIFSEDLTEKRSGTDKLIFRKKNVTFTIYKHTPHLLNITGVKSLTQLKNCKEEMEKHFGKKIKKERIDNLFFQKKIRKILIWTNSVFICMDIKNILPVTPMNFFPACISYQKINLILQLYYLELGLLP